MPDVPDSKNDIKDIRVAGCRVKLSFQLMEHGKWIVQGILQLLRGDTGGVPGLRTEGNQKFSSSADWRTREHDSKDRTSLRSQHGR